MDRDTDVMDAAPGADEVIRDPRRLEAVRRTGLLDTPPEEVFDRLTRLAARIVGAPVTFISLVDESRDFYMSSHGLPDPLATARQLEGPTFCHFSIRSDEPLIINDTRAHPEYCQVPTVESLGVAAYLGIPLVDGEGQRIGSFCAVDVQPREWRESEVEALRELAYAAMREIELRREVSERRAAEARITTILESITDAFFALDSEWRFTYLNSGARAVVELLLQRPAAEVVGLSFWEAVPQFRGTRFEAEYRRVVEEQKPRHFEEYAPSFDTWFEVHAYPSGDGLAVYFRDVTERHRTQEALRESEETLRQIAENVREVFWVSDPDYTRLHYISPSYEHVFGRSVESAYRDPTSFLEGVHPDDRERVARELPRMRHGDYDVQYRVIRPDGELRWVWARSSPVRSPDGVVHRAVGIVEDITRVKLAEQELAELLERERDARGEAERRAVEEAALRRAAAAVTAAYSVDEASRQIAESAVVATHADGAFVERIDIERGVLVVSATAGEHMPALGSTVTYEGSYAEYVVERQEPVLIPSVAEADRPLPEGMVSGCGDCSALVIPLLDAGEPIGTLILVRSFAKQTFRPDETARAQTFGDLAALAFRKIHLLEDSLKRREELEQVTESRARLIRGFSHDLKNPLGAADGHAQLLQDGILGELSTRQLDSVDRIRRSIHAALDLINDLVELARAEAGQIEIEVAATDVRDIARDLTGEYRAQAEGAGQLMECDLPDTFPVVRSDPTRVRQVVGNLISNAIKYNRPGGTVRVRVTQRERRGARAGRWITVEVEDTGIGIPEEKRDLLFREFSRIQPETTPGAGLGLAISQRIAVALGGEITVQSRVGEGSVFTLWLPADEPGAD